MYENWTSCLDTLMTIRFSGTSERKLAHFIVLVTLLIKVMFSIDDFLILLGVMDNIDGGVLFLLAISTTLLAII